MAEAAQEVVKVVQEDNNNHRDIMITKTTKVVIWEIDKAVTRAAIIEEAWAWEEDLK